MATLPRSAVIGLGLVASGACFGAVVGMLLVTSLFLWVGLTSITSSASGGLSALVQVLAMALPLGAAAGAVPGALLAPLAALTFMRRVPLWRLYAEPTAGAIVGGAVGLVLGAGMLSVIGLGVVGAVGAGLRLARAVARWVPRG